MFTAATCMWWVFCNTYMCGTTCICDTYKWQDRPHTCLPLKPPDDIHVAASTCMWLTLDTTYMADLHTCRGNIHVQPCSHVWLHTCPTAVFVVNMYVTYTCVGMTCMSLVCQSSVTCMLRVSRAYQRPLYSVTPGRAGPLGALRDAGPSLSRALALTVN